MESVIASHAIKMVSHACKGNWIWQESITWVANICLWKQTLKCFITYERRTLQSLVVSDVRHASVSGSDTDMTPVLRSIFGTLQVSTCPCLCRVWCPCRCWCFIIHNRYQEASTVSQLESTNRGTRHMHACNSRGLAQCGLLYSVRRGTGSLCVLHNVAAAI